MSELISLKREYNQALKRYHNMVKWCDTASREEQEKQYKNVIDVINTCSKLRNEIEKKDKLVNSNEWMNGFKGV